MRPALSLALLGSAALLLGISASAQAAGRRRDVGEEEEGEGPPLPSPLVSSPPAASLPVDISSLPRPGVHFTWDELLSSRDPYPPTSDDKLRMYILVRDVLDPLREALGRPILVNSAYRSPKYNATIDGASSTSWHRYGSAADIEAPAYTKQVSGTVVKVPAMNAGQLAKQILRLGLPYDQIIAYARSKGGHVHVGHGVSGTGLPWSDRSQIKVALRGGKGYATGRSWLDALERSPDLSASDASLARV